MRGPLRIIPVKKPGCLRTALRAIMPPMLCPIRNRGRSGYLSYIIKWLNSSWWHVECCMLPASSCSEWSHHQHSDQHSQCRLYCRHSLRDQYDHDQTQPSPSFLQIIRFMWLVLSYLCTFNFYLKEFQFRYKDPGAQKIHGLKTLNIFPVGPKEGYVFSARKVRLSYLPIMTVKLLSPPIGEALCGCHNPVKCIKFMDLSLNRKPT